MEIFKLFGSIFVDTDAADESLKKTENNAESVATSFSNGVKTVASWGTAIAGAAAAGATALWRMANNSAAAMDEIDKGSAKIGISKQAYQEWSYVMGQNGMDISALGTGMKTLVNQMESAANGSATASAYFNQLGISIYDTNGNLKDQETMLNETIYALAEVEDRTLKSALATDLFGKAGTEMLPMLNSGAEGMSDLTQRAHDLGLVMSDEAVTSGVVLGDTMDDVKQSFSAVVNTVGVSVMPIIQTFMDWILENMPVIKETVSVAFNIIENVVTTVVEGLKVAFDVLWTVCSNVWDTVGQPIFDAIKGTFEAFSGDADEKTTTISELFKTLWDICENAWEQVGQPMFEIIKSGLAVVKEVFEENMPKIQAFFKDAIDGIKETWENHLKPAFEAIGNFIENVLKPAFEVAFGAISEVVSVAFDTIIVAWTSVLKPAFDGICDFVENVFSGDWYGAWTAIVDTFADVFGGIADVAKVPINWVIGYINKAIDAINGLSFDVPDWVPGIGGDVFGFNIPNIPELAKGGVLEKGQVGLLEGTGAEAVVPLENNSGWVRKVAQDFDAVTGNDEVLKRILDVLTEIRDDTPERFADIIASMQFEVNHREFARLVKAVN